jgi:CubicO group peptidase (beta-lactamase class C family)
MRLSNPAVIAAAFLFYSFSAFAQSHSSATTFTKQLSDYTAAHPFNGTILIEEGNRRLYTHSFGYANFQFNAPNTNATKYKIASITKLFTSVLIMQLVEQGKIDLAKPIATYLPRYRGEGAQKVSIFHLLTATSGIASNEQEMTADEIPFMYLRPYTTDQLLDTFCSGKLEHEPGKTWNYNNADYVILGKIIESVYGQSYSDVLNRQILQPLNMKHTGMFSMNKIIKGLANVYEVIDSTHMENTPPMYTENYYAAGGLYSNAEDLLKFANGLYGYRLVTKASCEAIITPYLAGYGLGLWISSKEVHHQKVRIAERQGAIWGTKTRLVRVPEKNITVILLSNVQTTSIDDLQRFILEKLLQ